MPHLHQPNGPLNPFYDGSTPVAGYSAAPGEAMTAGTLNTGVQVGADLVQVSAHMHPQIDPCTPHQGKVYSISGTSDVFPKLTERPPYHPNCKHVLTFVTEKHLARKGQLEALREISNSENAFKSYDDYREAVKKATPKKPVTPGRVEAAPGTE